MDRKLDINELMDIIINGFIGFDKWFGLLWIMSYL